MNKFEIVGRLAKDVKVLGGADGKTAVAFLTVMAQQPFVSKKSGKREADAPQVKWFLRTESQVAFAKKYFTKGVLVSVDGRISTGRFEKDGKTVYTTDLIVTNANPFLAKDPHKNAGAPTTKADEQQGEPASEQSGVDVSDDDIPF